MRKRSAIFGLLALGVLGGTFYFFLKEKAPSQPQAIEGDKKPAVESTRPKGPGTNELTVLGRPILKPRLFKARGYPPRTPEEKAMWDWWNYMEKTDKKFQWKTPIEFYGKVVDQDGNPIQGATIECNWAAMHDQPNKRTLSSGPDGQFTLTGVQGKVLSVNVFKSGYHFGKESQGAFEYAAFFEPHFHVPDPNNPIIFRLRKEGVTEPMIHRLVAGDLSTDGVPRWLDMDTGKLESSGQLGFAIARSNESEPTKFDYTVTVHAATGGGVILSEDEFMFQAPSEGYQPSVKIEQKQGDPNYSWGQKLRLYVKTRTGQYAAVKVEIAQFNRPAAGIQLLYYFNPSGSRNLEYDPDKRINKKAY